MRDTLFSEIDRNIAFIDSVRVHDAGPKGLSYISGECDCQGGGGALQRFGTASWRPAGREQDSQATADGSGTHHDPRALLLCRGALLQQRPAVRPHFTSETMLLCPGKESQIWGLSSSSRSLLMQGMDGTDKCSSTALNIYELRWGRGKYLTIGDLDSYEPIDPGLQLKWSWLLQDILTSSSAFSIPAALSSGWRYRCASSPPPSEFPCMLS